MNHISTDLINLYQRYFQKPYVIGADFAKMADGYVKDDFTSQALPIKETINGVEVFLPVEFTNQAGDFSLKVPCATIRVTTKNTIIRTELSDRRGSVKEQYNSGDYIFTIKGVLISSDRGFPYEEIVKLRDMATNESAIYLKNAYAELFLPGENKVAIDSLEFPEQEGKHIRFRPFVMVCETDFIDTLTLK